MPSRLSALAGDLRIRAGVAAVVLVWALYQCFWNIGGPNITGDEDIYLRAGWQYVHGDFSFNREHPPTAKYLFGLAQLVAGQGPIGPRVLVALLTFGVGIALYGWLRRELGYWGALLAAALWWLTPRGGAGPRVDRLALLDPVMTAFAVLAVATAWVWIRGDRWWLAPVSGALMALSVTSKVSTVVLLPAFLLLPVLFRAWRRLLVGGAMWAVAFGIVFLVSYVPMGVRSAIRYMIDFQEGQNTLGHPITIGGTVYRFAPWWANLHFMEAGTGALLLVVLAVGVVAALGIRPDRLVAYVGVVLALLVGFYVVVAKIALPTYYSAWMPFLLVLAAIGLARLPRVPVRRAAPVATALSLVVVLSLVVPSVRLSQDIARQHPTGIALLGDYLDAQRVPDGKILFVSATPGLFVPYVAERGTTRADQGPYVAIVVGNDRRFPPSGAVTQLFATERSRFSVAEVGGLQVWLPKDGRVVLQSGALTVQG